MVSISIIEYEGNDMDGDVDQQECQEFEINGKGISKINNIKNRKREVSIFTGLSNIGQKVNRTLSDLFLPVGYPHTVSPGYLQYQVYDSIQGLSSYLRGVVSTSAILTVAGVGDAEATALSVAVQWALMDGCGMIGGLVFSYYTSSHFDSHVKEFRLFADVINDVGSFLDMLAPVFAERYGSRNVMVLSTVATLCRVMCGMSAGATKSCITQHFSNGNIADLSAKEGTQETLVSLVGMILGIWLARFLQDMEDNCKILESNTELSPFYRFGAFYATWCVFIMLTIVHIVTNYWGIKVVKLNTLNRERCEVALRKVIDRMALQVEIKDAEVDDQMTLQSAVRCDTQKASSISTPNECCESLWNSWRKLMWGDNIRLGVRISDAFRGLSVHEIKNILDLYKNEEYVLTVNKGIIYVSLRAKKCAPCDDKVGDATMVEMNEANVFLKSFVHAIIIQEALGNGKKSTSTLNDSALDFITRSKTCVDRLFPKKGRTLLDLLEENGWSIQPLYLEYGSARFEIR